jgi:hypothetical protein
MEEDDDQVALGEKWEVVVNLSKTDMRQTHEKTHELRVRDPVCHGLTIQCMDAVHCSACVRPMKIVIEKVLCGNRLYQIGSGQRWIRDAVYS